jgi:hypothetical protein
LHAYPKLPERNLQEAALKNTERSMITVAPVDGRAAWRAFHRLAYRVYKDDPNWVAPLLLERKLHFDKSHNPFFQHADAAFWVAWRDGIPVGRVTAQIDALHLERYHDATGHFGFIEAVDDPSVFAALLATAETWLKQRGMRRSVGPVSFSMWDEPGLLVEGFEHPPNVLMGHALPYYQKHIVASGYIQVQDLLAYDYEIHQPLPESLQNLVTRVQQKTPFTFRSMRMDKRNFEAEVALLLDIVNDAWADNWGFVPMTQAELDDLAGVFKFLLPPEAIVIAEVDGEAAGFSLMLPNLNEAIRDLKGQLFPFGFIKMLWRLKISGLHSGRMPLMGVRRKWRHSPVGAVVAILIVQHAKIGKYARTGDHGELSWILDSNKPVKHMLAQFGAKLIKRYRIYEKSLEDMQRERI